MSSLREQIEATAVNAIRAWFYGNLPEDYDKIGAEVTRKLWPLVEPALAAARAEIEREVRAEVAADIEREADKIVCDDPRANGMMAAAEIARGGA